MRTSLVGLIVLTLSILIGACGSELSEEAEIGRALVADHGCVACHGETDGIGPAWGAVWGTDRELADGSTVVFYADYVRTSLLDPKGQVLKGFDPVMPAFSLSEDQLSAIIKYLEETG